MLSDLVCVRPCSVSFQPIGIHREVDFAADPAFMLLDQEAADQALDARFVGEDADDAFAPSDFFVQALDAVRRPQPLAIGFGQMEDGCDVGERVIQEPGGFRGDRLELGQQTIATPTGFREVRAVVEGFQAAVDRRSLFGRDFLQEVAGEMGLAALPHGPLELFADRFD